MSNLNIEKIDLKDKEKYLQFLGSKEFPDIIKNYSLGFVLYNKLFAAHVLAIGLNSTGIKEGHIKLGYLRTSLRRDFDSNGKEGREWTNYYPHLEFCFRISTNGLIQNRISHTTNSSLKIYNKYDSYAYSRSRDFSRFIDEYQKRMPELDDEEHLFANDAPPELLTIDIKFDHSRFKAKDDKLNLVFEQMIINQPEIYSFLKFHFLQLDILTKDNSIQKKEKNAIKTKI